MFTKGAELTMNRDNISALVMTITVLVVVSVIVGLNQAWSVQQQQKDRGLVVVGGSVHSPEFQFEKKYANVKERCSNWNNSSGNSSWNGRRKSYYDYYDQD
jgi:hypothetical protein